MMTSGSEELTLDFGNRIKRFVLFSLLIGSLLAAIQGLGAFARADSLFYGNDPGDFDAVIDRLVSFLANGPA